MNRREFIRVFGLGGLGLVVGDIGIESVSLVDYRRKHEHLSVYHDTTKDIFYEYREFTFAQERPLSPFYLVFLSDVHLSPAGAAHVDLMTTRSVITTINSLMRRVDSEDWIFVLGGDLVNHTATDSLQHLYPETSLSAIRAGIASLGDIKAADKLFILGNHEHGHSHLPQIVHGLEAANYRQMDAGRRNFRFKGVEVYGLPDFTTVRYTPTIFGEINKTLGSSAAKIILTHNPQLMLHLHPSNTLSLSGHTHGGHFAQTGLSQKMASTLALHEAGFRGRYIEGEYEMGADSRLLVNNGIGDHPRNFGSLRTAARTVQIIKIS